MSAVQFHAMGTTVQIHGSTDAGGRVRAVFEGYEQRFSRFRPGSELSWINEHRGRWVAVSTPMAQVLSAAADAKARTGGLIDIGIGSALATWGYDRTFDDVVSLDQAPDRSVSPEWAIDEQWAYVGEHTCIDLGGIAKGWACDRVVESGAATVVSAGGDLRSIDESLVVEILDPRDDIVAEVEVGAGALATSSTAKRRWAVAGHEANHLIDPRTMRPADSPVVSASVVASTAVEAEAGAKAVLFHGVDGLAWADRQPWIRRAIVIWHDGCVYANREKEKP